MVTRYVWNMIAFFALPLRLSVNHSHTFKVTILRSTSIKKNQHQLKIKILSDLVDCLLRYQCSIANKILH